MAAARPPISVSVTSTSTTMHSGLTQATHGICSRAVMAVSTNPLTVAPLGCSSQTSRLLSSTELPSMTVNLFTMSTAGRRTTTASVAQADRRAPVVLALRSGLSPLAGMASTRQLNRAIRMLFTLNLRMAALCASTARPARARALHRFRQRARLRCASTGTPRC